MSGYVLKYRENFRFGLVGLDSYFVQPAKMLDDAFVFNAKINKASNFIYFNLFEFIDKSNAFFHITKQTVVLVISFECKFEDFVHLGIRRLCKVFVKRAFSLGGELLERGKFPGRVLDER